MDPLGESWTESQQLIDVLRDPAARWDERDDAAIYLAGVDEPEALAALMQVGRNAKEDETLLETIGEAIAEIASRHPERVSDDIIAQLAPPAFRGFREHSSS